MHSLLILVDQLFCCYFFITTECCGFSDDLIQICQTDEPVFRVFEELHEEVGQADAIGSIWKKFHGPTRIADQEIDDRQLFQPIGGPDQSID